MLIQSSDFSINVEFPAAGKTERPYVFFLHGFSGSAADWYEIIPMLDDRFNYAAVDLPGHGESDCPIKKGSYTAESIVHNLFETFKEITADKFFLAGYSMGGRTALSFASKHAGLLKGLILESTTPGITDSDEREQRVKHDDELATFIENHTIEEFVEYWMNIDIFNTQKNLPQEKLNAVRELKLKNKKLGLINTLRGFGTGAMPPLSDASIKLDIQSLLITGSLDKKYMKINENLAAVFPSSRYEIIEDAGHNTHLEKPEKFCDVINAYLKEF